MSIREYANSIGFEVIGKLTRCSKLEKSYNYDLEKYERVSKRVYMDEADNVYHVGFDNGICIITADGAVI